MTHEEVYHIALEKLYPIPELQVQAVSIISQYNIQFGFRVKCAILKLAGSSLSALEQYVRIAQNDTRDVISQAEYPAQFAAGFGNGGQKLARKDLDQYEAWIESL